MYLSHFGLAELPFSIAPDPRYLFMSRRHQEALAHLLFGLGGEGGFVVLTGEIGAGKTTVCRCLLEQVPGQCDVAYVFNPKLNVEELLATLCTEFRILPTDEHPSMKMLVDRLNEFLLQGHAKGRHAVLIIDEAQNLSSDVLEQMRLLTNLETHQRKLLQIILIGQPELADMLARPSLRQLAQRVVARYHLGALDRDEVVAYVHHRLEIAGAPRAIIPRERMSQLYRLSGGVPRILNLLCDRALLGAYVEGKRAVDRRTLARAAREVFPVQARQSSTVRSRRRMVFPAFGALAVILAAVGMYAVRPHAAFARATVIPRIAVRPSAAPIAAAGAAHSPAGLVVWPASVDQARAHQLAYEGLYAAWRSIVPSQGACAPQGELRCHRALGGLGDLQSIDRPAVLTLADGTGQQKEATLLGLGAHSANLAVGGVKQTVALSALAMQWDGRYTVLWRPPTGGDGVVRLGDRNGEVSWITTKIAKSEGRVNPTGKVTYDPALRQAVRQFQLTRGLVPDGQVGVQTLLRLSEIDDPTAPVLRRE